MRNRRDQVSGMSPDRRRKRAVPGTKEERGGTGTTREPHLRSGRVLGSDVRPEPRRPALGSSRPAQIDAGAGNYLLGGTSHAQEVSRGCGHQNCVGVNEWLLRRYAARRMDATQVAMRQRSLVCLCLRFLAAMKTVRLGEHLRGRDINRRQSTVPWLASPA